MLKGLEDKTVLITGAAGGIGAAACERFLAEGARVVATDLETTSLEHKVGDSFVTVSGDLRDRKVVDKCVQTAIDKFGGLDLAFLNAGIECQPALLKDFSESEYDRVFNINVKAAFFCAQAVVNHLLESGKPGGILFCGSISGLRGGPMLSIYHASKHAIVGLAKSLALETGATGIRVNVLCPGGVKTRLMASVEKGMAAASALDQTEMKEAILGSIPMGRYGQPEEIAAMAAWALSDEASYCHGEVLTVSGGGQA